MPLDLVSTERAHLLAALVWAPSRLAIRAQIEEAYDLFQLEKQGALLSAASLDFYGAGVPGQATRAVRD